MNKKQLSELIRRELGIPWWAPILNQQTRIYLADNTYEVCPIEEIKKRCLNLPYQGNYVPEKNDCDDATSRLLKNLTWLTIGYLKEEFEKAQLQGIVGFGWSPHHAFGLAYDDRLYVVEPYGNGVTPYSEAKQDPFRRYDLALQSLIVI